MAYRDIKNSIDTAKQEGKNEKALEIAKNMLADGVDINLIKKYSGLTQEHIIRKTKCFRIWERNAIISKTKRNFSRLYPTPQNFKKIDRLRRNEIHLKAVRTSS